MACDDSISKIPWFHGLLPREEVKLLLSKNGDYLLRMSEPSAGQTRHLVLSVMQNQDDPSHEGMHYVIRTDAGRYSITERESFGSLLDLVTHHRSVRLNENVPSSVLVGPICRQPWELNHEDVTMTKTLGEGAFGEVRSGTLRLPTGAVVDVAVKVAKLEKCTKEQIREITTEARLMRKFDHRNVVRCWGVAAVEEPLLVVMELVQGGGLDGYLKKNQVAMSEKMDIIHQVAAGLAYIHKQNIMHRDIASRNVLYGNQVAKVSDFGLSRVGSVYQMDPNKKAPIRWLSPETMVTFTYTHATDVFAFGVLCWEVLENGQMPYPGLTVSEVHQKVVKDDFRMSIRPEAPQTLQDIIKKCWLRDSNIRPRMEEVNNLTMTFSLQKKVDKRGLGQERARIIPAPKGHSGRSRDKTGRRKIHQKRPSAAGFGKGSQVLSGSQRDDVLPNPSSPNNLVEKEKNDGEKKPKGGHKHKKGRSKDSKDT